jgi:hypothetical protein
LRAAGRPDEATDLLLAQFSDDAGLLGRRTLIILLDARDLTSENAARRIDLVDRDQAAEIQRGERGGKATGGRPDPADLERLLLLRESGAGAERGDTGLRGEAQ